MKKVQKFDDEKRIVTGVVYAPGTIDTHGDTMTAKAIEEMAHRYMALNLAKTIDAFHDNVSKECQPIESFIARAGDPDFPEGAWVLSVKVNDDSVWSAIKSGDINGYSFEAYVSKVNTVVIVETMPLTVSQTEPDPEDGHTHFFAVKVDEDGKVVEGRTSTANGHSHEITKGTATGKALTLAGREHSHRIFI